MLCSFKNWHVLWPKIADNADGRKKAILWLAWLKMMGHLTVQRSNDEVAMGKNGVDLHKNQRNKMDPNKKRVGRIS